MEFRLNFPPQSGQVHRSFALFPRFFQEIYVSSSMCNLLLRLVENIYREIDGHIPKGRSNVILLRFQFHTHADSYGFATKIAIFALCGNRNSLTGEYRMFINSPGDIEFLFILYTERIFACFFLYLF